MEVTLGTYSIAAFIIALVVLSLDLVIYVGSGNRSSRAFVFFTFVVALWVTSHGFFRAVSHAEVAESLIRLNYFFGGVIAAGFFYFSLVFPEDRKPRWWILPSIVALQSLFFYLYFFTDALLLETIWVGGIQMWEWGYGSSWFLFEIFFFGFWLSGIGVIYAKYRKAPRGDVAKKRLQYMFIGLVIGVMPPGIVNVTLPRFGYYELDWSGPLTSLGWVCVIAYSIMQFRQLDVKAVAAEVFVLVMTVVLFVNIFVSKLTIGMIGRVFIFTAFSVAGVFLIKGVLRETAQREELEVLNAELTDFNENLERKVQEQAEKVTVAYKAEQLARVELEAVDRAKDQFLLATQHHLRTPLTIIKGCARLIADRKKGPLTPQAKDSITRIENAVDHLSILVNKLLFGSERELRQQR